jgi:2-polyprenyl-3-methyl-5-hydroxy-6-metoxy-1,4-benzoquinol methylase
MLMLSIHKVDSIMDMSFKSIDNINAVLPEFPSAQIEKLFKRNNVLLDDVNKIPKEFSKYFAVMSDLAGGNIRGKRLLDVGTGLGVFISQAKCLGMIPTGIDLFTEYHDTCYRGAMCVFQAYGHSIEDAQQALVKQDMTNFVASENKFDFITSFGMLEHIHSAAIRKRIIQNMMKSLAPAGSLLLVCGPNKYFPFDLYHYGPKFLFYHCIPLLLKKYYLKAFAKSNQRMDPKWLNGIKVSEILQSIAQIDSNANIVQGFPLWVRLARSKWLQWNPVRSFFTALSELLSGLRMEPVIIIIATTSIEPSDTV